MTEEIATGSGSEKDVRLRSNPSSIPQESSEIPAFFTMSSTTVAASASNVNEKNSDDDGICALRTHLLDQLTTIYGFDSKICTDAIDTVVHHYRDTAASVTIFDQSSTLLQQCIDYILENNLAPDLGGPVVPIDSCPHILELSAYEYAHMIASSSKDEINYYFPTIAKCSHDMSIHNAVINDDNDTTNNYERREAQYKSIYDEDDVAINETLGNSTTPRIRRCCPSTENWLCLSCGVVRCSRYVNGHSYDHYILQQQKQKQQTNMSDSLHDNNSTLEGRSRCSVSISLTDLSVWCHSCNSYITNPTILNPIVHHLECMKFPTASS